MIHVEHLEYYTVRGYANFQPDPKVKVFDSHFVHDQDVGFRNKDGLLKLLFKVRDSDVVRFKKVCLLRATFPETVRMSLKGRRMHDVIGHDLFAPGTSRGDAVIASTSMCRDQICLRSNTTLLDLRDLPMMTTCDTGQYMATFDERGKFTGKNAWERDWCERSKESYWRTMMRQQILERCPEAVFMGEVE